MLSTFSTIIDINDTNSLVVTIVFKYAEIYSSVRVAFAVMSVNADPVCISINIYFLVISRVLYSIREVSRVAVVVELTTFR